MNALEKSIGKQQSSTYTKQDLETIHKQNKNVIDQANKGLPYAVIVTGWYIRINRFTSLITEYIDGNNKRQEHDVVL